MTNTVRFKSPALRAVLGLVLFLAAGVSSHASTATDNTFENPSRQLKADGLKHLSSSPRILIPVVYSENLIAGVHKASKGGAHARVTAANVGITPELGRKIADELLADLVTRLKAAGREVLLYADVKDHPVIASLKEWPPHKTHQLPIASVNVGYGAMEYLVSTPTGTPVVQHANTVVFDVSNAMRFAKVAKDKDAIALVPTYRFQSPVLYGSTRGGISKSYASVGIMPAMHLVWGGFQFLSPKGAWGSYMMDGVNTIELAEHVGELEKTSESKSADVSLFDFGTFRSMAKGGYLLTVDTDAYYAAALKAGRELNALFVAQLK